MMRRLFLTISFVIVSRTLIIILWEDNEDNEVMDQVVTKAGLLLSIVLILTLSWSIRDSVNKMR